MVEKFIRKKTLFAFQEINILLDKINNLNANDIDLKVIQVLKIHNWDNIDLTNYPWK